MEFSSDQIAAIIGTKELELVALRMEVARLRQFEPKPAVREPSKEELEARIPVSNVQPIKEVSGQSE